MGRIRFGNPVQNRVEGMAAGPALVCKVEKSGELFALEMERDEASFST
jgi:hypothetical protein